MRLALYWDWLLMLKFMVCLLRNFYSLLKQLTADLLDVDLYRRKKAEKKPTKVGFLKF